MRATAGSECLAESDRLGNSKYLVERWAPEIGIDQQNAPTVRPAQCQCEVSHGERFALARHGTGDHESLQTGIHLKLVERCAKPAILFDHQWWRIRAADQLTIERCTQR